MANMNNTKLHVVYGDATLGLHGEGFDYIFSYGGGPESIVIDGKEWLYRTLKPTFWRATTDNDKGNRLHMRSGMWLAADMFLPCRGVKVCIDGNEELPKAPMNNQFVGNEKFLMGNVDTGITNKDIMDEFKCCNVYAKDACKKCFAKFYCSGGCAANAYNFTGSINGTYDVGCELQRKRVECAIMMKAAQME